MKRLVLLALALVIISAPAFAVNVLPNGDFAAGQGNWQVWGGMTDANRSPLLFNASSGSAIISMNGSLHHDYNGVVYQEFAVAPNSTYTVNGHVWTIDDTVQDTLMRNSKRYAEIFVYNTDATFDTPTSGDFSAAYGTGTYNGNTINGLAKASSTANPPTGQIGIWNFTNMSTQMVRWANPSVTTFTTGATQTKATLILHCGSATNGSGNDAAIYMDDLTVEGPAVPEPGSLVALMSGFIGLGGMIIRRKK